MIKRSGAILPDQKLSDLTCSLRITGTNLKPASAAASPSAQSF
jgi:hypothetical protein